jgi:hypothetical protein
MADSSRRLSGLVACVAAVAWLCLARTGAQVPPSGSADNTFNDSHFHLTNYIQQGIDVRQFLQIMGTRVGRSTLFGIPLQQQWSYANSGDFAPTYYLHSDAPLYYYSFTDAYIASQYRSLSKEEQARFDPMITGFDPADMYGVDHIRRVLTTFPASSPASASSASTKSSSRPRSPARPRASPIPRLIGSSTSPWKPVSS